MNILKVCPFCGSEAEFQYSEQDDGFGHAQCTSKSCGIGFFDDRDSAIKAWNSRNLDKNASEAILALTRAFSDWPLNVTDTEEKNINELLYIAESH